MSDTFCEHVAVSLKCTEPTAPLRISVLELLGVPVSVATMSCTVSVATGTLYTLNLLNIPVDLW